MFNQTDLRRNFDFRDEIGEKISRLEFLLPKRGVVWRNSILEMIFLICVSFSVF